jgi:hypothetical protein
MRRFTLAIGQSDPCDPLGLRYHLGRDGTVVRLCGQGSLKDSRSNPCGAQDRQQITSVEHLWRPFDVVGMPWILDRANQFSITELQDMQMSRK